MSDPFHSTQTRSWHTVLKTTIYGDNWSAAKRLSKRDQTRRTKGVVVGGAVPGGALYSKCGPESVRALRVAGTLVAAREIEVTPHAALSAAAVDACRRAAS